MSLAVHFEIHGSDPQQLIDFYSSLFGWTFTRFGEMPYWVIETGDGSIQMDTPGWGINGGLAQREGPKPEVGGPLNGANIVVSTDDVDATLARGIELGGASVLPPETVEGVGRTAYLIDPDHNIIGLIAPQMPS